MAVAIESKKDAIAALEESAKVKFTYDKDSKPVLEDAPAQPAKAAKAASRRRRRGSSRRARIPAWTRRWPTADVLYDW